jgi:hypothetical protein
VAQFNQIAASRAVLIEVANVLGAFRNELVLIKAFALDERKNVKDAYDVAFVMHHYEPNLVALAERLRPHAAMGLGREAYQILKAKFGSIDSVGPVGAAAAIPGTGQDVEQLSRAAFEDAQELFRLVDQELSWTDHKNHG